MHRLKATFSGSANRQAGFSRRMLSSLMLQHQAAFGSHLAAQARAPRLDTRRAGMVG